MLSTHTRSSRVATCASELIPTKYLKSPTPCLYILHLLCDRCPTESGAPTLRRHGLPGFRRAHGRCRQAELSSHLLAPACLHPGIGRLGVVDDFAHVRVEPEDAVRQTQRIERVSHCAHAAHEIRASAPNHDIERRSAVLAEMLAQRIGHGAKRLEDVGVVRLTADDE